MIEVTEVVYRKDYSFIDYLRSGTHLSFVIAIDFTGSNGEYSNPNSLHYTSYNNPNQYERAIWEVGTILEAYDTDKLFPVFGFGGIPRGGNSVNHAFPLTFDMNNPFVLGVQGILDSYHAALKSVALSGPTLFHYIIDNLINISRNSFPKVYNVLLILTDGAIMDMDETIKSIIVASALPISIIIVGVGNSDFSSMESLDCDTGRLTDSRGNSICRDIVQFVPFSKFAGNSVALAAEVLREVPHQLVEFMKFNNYVPILPEQIPLEQALPYEESLPPLYLPSLPPEEIEPSAPEEV